MTDPAAVRAVAEALPSAINFRFVPPRLVGDQVWSEVATDLLTRLASDPAAARSVVAALITPEMLAEALDRSWVPMPHPRRGEPGGTPLRHRQAAEIVRALTEDPNAV